MQSKQWQKVFIANCLNFLVALYMVYEHFSEAESSSCDVSSIISCTAIKNSSFSTLFGVPVAFFGVIWSGTLLSSLVYLYMIAPVAAKREKAMDIMLFMYVWNILGSLFVVYLLCAEVYVGAICPVCTVTHITIFFMLLVCRGMYWENKHSGTSLFGAIKGSLTRSRKDALVCGLIIGLLFLTPIIYFHHGAPASTVTTKSTTSPPVDDIKLLPLRDHLKFAACFMRVPEGLHFYGITGCSHCAEQKRNLGDLLSAVVYHECDAECQSTNNIYSIPTWIYHDGEEEFRAEGVQTLRQLFTFCKCDQAGW